MIRLPANLNFRGLSCTVLTALVLTGCPSAPTTKVEPSAVAHCDLGSTPPDTIATTTGSLPVPAAHHRLTRHQTVLDPRQDGWNTEATSELAERALKHWLSDPTNSKTDLSASIGPEITITPLAPSTPAIVYQQDSMEIRRWSAQTDDALPTQRGLPAFTKVVEDFRSAFTGVGETRLEVKTIAIAEQDTRVQTTHLVTTAATGNEQSLEHHSRYVCEWNRSAASLQLVKLNLSAFESTRCVVPDGRIYSDVTNRELGHLSAYRDQLRWGLNYWLKRIETAHGMYVFAEYGLAVGDANGDGLDDIYLCQPGGLPNRLLIRDNTGRLQDQTDRSQVGWLDHTSSALWIDIDNDGDQDLAVALESRHVIVMSNDGDGHFQVSAELPIVDRHVQGLSATDYDQDGLLDVYLTVGFADERARIDEDRPEFVYHDANEGGANVLFRNTTTPDGISFADVTRSVGLDIDNRRHSLAAAWEDFDNDGDPDLYVANDYGANCLYRNDNGYFTNIAAASQVEDYGSGMSVSWADFDRDGRMDLYVGNMFSTAGQRITSQANFRPHDTEHVRRQLRRFAKGNTLFRQASEGRFDDVGERFNVEFGRWAWSSLFTDINNDGNQDLFVANGYITTDDTGDL